MNALDPVSDQGLTRRQFVAAATAMGAANYLVAPAIAAEARWASEVRLGRFFCHADFPLGELRTLLNELTVLQRDVHGRLRVKASNETIHLIFFQKNSTYRAYLRTYFPKAPYRRALYIKERGVGMLFAYKNRDLITDVRHEATHAILHASLPMVPLWLDEGLAEYFEVPENSRASGNPHLSSIQWSLYFSSAPSLAKLESISSLSKMGKTQYRDAWAWVHWMMHGPPKAYDELLRYFSDIERQTPPGQLSHRIRRRVPNMQQSFVKHFRYWKKSKV